jgi:DNA-binding response OmpR family regulator
MSDLPAILIIDNDSNTRLSLARILGQMGYHVSTASDGSEGMYKAVHTKPHCIIIEVVIPGISGFDLCRQLRHLDPQHRQTIILMGSRSTPVEHKWASRHGADHYLPKPFDEKTLLHLLEKVWDERSYPPIATQPLRVDGQRFTKQQTLPDWIKLVPHRKENPHLLTTANPLAGSVAIRDKHARRLHAAIDGKKNVEELTRVTHLQTNEMFAALRVLIVEQRIQLYTSKGDLADISTFF